MNAIELLRREAERRRLARLLGCSPDALDFLVAVSAADLRSLRQACHAHLAYTQRPLAQRAVKASRLLPTRILSNIGQATLGPRICARLGEQMSLPQLASLCRQMPPAFLAEASLDMDMEKLCAVAETFPPPLLQAIAGELLVRGEYLHVAELVDRLPLPLVGAAAQALRNGEGMLRTTFFIEQPGRLRELLEALPEATLQDGLRAVVRSPDTLLVPALAQLTTLPPVWQRRLIVMLLANSDTLLDELLRGVVKNALWSAALPLAGRLSLVERRRIMDLAGWHRGGVLEALLEQRRHPVLRAPVQQLRDAMPPELAIRTGLLLGESDAVRSRD